MNLVNLMSIKKELDTLSILSLFFMVLASLTRHFIYIYVAMGLLIIALFIRPLAKKITQGWLAFSELLGIFNSRIILTIIFYLCLTPLALVFRFYNKNALFIASSKNETSNFLERNHVFVKEDLEKMW